MTDRTRNPALEGQHLTEEERLRLQEQTLSEDAVTHSGRLELREERAIIEKTRRVVGAVTVGRKVVTETVQVPVELRREVIIFQAAPNGSGVTIDGDTLQPGETREVLIYAEEAEIGKRVVVAEEVSIGKQEVVETHQQAVTLSREVLDVDTEGAVQVDREDNRR